MKIFILKVILLVSISLACLFGYGCPLSAQDAVEEIIYEISPIGMSYYQDMGQVDFRGRRMNMVIFHTDVLGFQDTEKIYSDTQSGLPLWVERDVSFWLGKEYLTEEYVPSESRVTIIKFEEGRQTAKYVIQGKGPIHNAILLPFTLRKIPNLEIGWSCDIKLPQEFKVQLVDIEDVNVGAGKFAAYHFTSIPHKFEIWISADKLRLPVKIKGIGEFSYTLMMKQHIIQSRSERIH